MNLSVLYYIVEIFQQNVFSNIDADMFLDSNDALDFSNVTKSGNSL